VAAFTAPPVHTHYLTGGAGFERGRFQVDEARQHSERAPWSPYHGLPVSLRVAETYLRGRRIFDGERVLARPGDGRFLRPQESPLPAEPERLRA